MIETAIEFLRFSRCLLAKREGKFESTYFVGKEYHEDMGSNKVSLAQGYSI
jgi:hypothetical protein